MEIDEEAIKEILERYFMGAQAMVNGTYLPETIPTLVEESYREITADLTKQLKEEKV